VPAGFEKRHWKTFSHIYRNVGWMTLALACTVVNPLIDLAMVGPFASGSVSLVEYAGRLRGMPVLAMGGVLILLLGDWARQHHGDGHLLGWNSVRRVCYMTVIFCVPAVIVLLVTMDWWVPFIFRSPMFAAADIDMVKRLLLWYFPGVPFLAVAVVLSRAILVLKQARLLAFVSLTAVVVNIVANMILLSVIGLHGVAMSTSTVDIFVFVCYFFFVRRTLMAS
jgi:peptidoglycan biosynthesis protein MviN/MurJ (putative lipid II flippase)